MTDYPYFPPISFDFEGDHALAAQYIPVARTLMQQLVRRMEQSALDVQEWRVTGSDGVIYHLAKRGDVHAARIDVRARGRLTIESRKRYLWIGARLNLESIPPEMFPGERYVEKLTGSRTKYAYYGPGHWVTTNLPHDGDGAPINRLYAPIPNLVLMEPGWEREKAAATVMQSAAPSLSALGGDMNRMNKAQAPLTVSPLAKAKAEFPGTTSVSGDHVVVSEHATWEFGVEEITTGCGAMPSNEGAPTTLAVGVWDGTPSIFDYTPGHVVHSNAQELGDPTIEEMHALAATSPRGTYTTAPLCYAPAGTSSATAYLCVDPNDSGKALSDYYLPTFRENHGADFYTSQLPQVAVAEIVTSGNWVTDFSPSPAPIVSGSLQPHAWQFDSAAFLAIANQCAEDNHYNIPATNACVEAQMSAYYHCGPADQQSSGEAPTFLIVGNATDPFYMWVGETIGAIPVGLPPDTWTEISGSGTTVDHKTFMDSSPELLNALQSQATILQGTYELWVAAGWPQDFAPEDADKKAFWASTPVEIEVFIQLGQDSTPKHYTVPVRAVLPFSEGGVFDTAGWVDSETPTPFAPNWHAGAWRITFEHSVTIGKDGLVDGAPMTAGVTYISAPKRAWFS